MIEDHNITELREEIKELREQVRELTSTIEGLTLSRRNKKGKKLKAGSRVKNLISGKARKKGDVGKVTNIDIGKAFLHLQPIKRQEEYLRYYNHE